MNKFLILTMALTVTVGALTACDSATATRANNDADSAAARNKTPANNKSNPENKLPENKSGATEQTKLIEVYDGRSGATIDEKANKSAIARADRDFAEQEVLSRKALIKQTGAAQNEDEDIECTIDNFIVDGVGEGAFTTHNSSQKIYLYRLCEGGVGSMPTRLGGIMIAENAKVIAHYVYKELGGYTDLKTLPDINQNGLSEIVLQSASAVNQGYLTDSIELIEISRSGIIKMGDALVFSNSPDTGETADEAEQGGSSTAYKISVQIGKTPVFLRETYHRKTDDEKWQLKSEAAKFSLKNADGNKSLEYFKPLKR